MDLSVSLSLSPSKPKPQPTPLSLSLSIYIYISIYKEANFVAQNIVNWALLCNPDPRFLFGELGARWSVFPFFVIVSLFNEK